jgi:deaminated glutathione amidase
MRVAAVQMVSESQWDRNLVAAERLIAEAVLQGAQWVLLPENFALFGQPGASLNDPQRAELCEFLCAQARRWSIWLAGGTLPLITSEHGPAEANKTFASCCVLNPEGETVARYDKIHLFDAGVQDAVGAYRESAQFSPGKTPGLVNSPWGKVGLSVCYDLRFPEYFRLLSQQGAQVFMVPSAFVYTTGQAHWEILLRARAIENQCFVVAANQGGSHAGNRRTWGHSMIVGPWGDVLGVLPSGEGVVVADLDFTHLAQVRERMPVLSHRRF